MTQRYNDPVSDRSLIACPHCDLLQRLPVLTPGESARCPRCEELLVRRHAPSLDRPLALAIAAAFLYVIANAVPMLGLSVLGRQAFTTVIGGAEYLWTIGYQAVAILVLFAVVLAPGLQIGILLVVLFAARRKTPPHWLATLLRFYPTARTWSMIEVMMLGVLIALVKIADYAQVIPGFAMFVLGALVFLVALIESSFDPAVVWERIEWAQAADERAAARGPAKEAAS